MDGAPITTYPDSGVSRFQAEQVIPGFAEALRAMKVGERRRLWIPEALAYGERAGTPKGMLGFNLELVAVE
jgi:FKBP-type peptidyl-prolyl cis-trans isomerase